MGAEPTQPQCPLCGSALRPQHCKYLCPNHGIVIDCADPFF